MSEPIKAIATRLVEGGDDQWHPADYAESKQREEDMEAAGQWILDRLAADAWQAEPSEEGAVFVKDCDGVFACGKGLGDGKWWVAKCITDDGMRVHLSAWQPLNGRRVRQIRRGE